MTEIERRLAIVDASTRISQLREQGTYTCKTCGKTDLKFRDIQPFLYVKPQFAPSTAIYGSKLVGDELVWAEYAPIVCSEACHKKFILEHDYFYPTLMENVGVPTYLPCSSFNKLTNDSNTKEVNYLKQMIRNENARGVYLWGISGCGKTRMAVAMAFEWRKLGYNVRFLSMSDVQAFLRASINIEEVLKPLVYDPFGQPWDVIIVDELTVEFDGKFGKQRMKELMMKWYENGITCIFTSNFNLKTFGESIDTAIVSRLKEMCESLRMPDVDYRVKNEDISRQKN